MRGIYRWLLYLYPADFREEFGAEMAWVRAQAGAAVAQGWPTQAMFVLREVGGLVAGAVEERVRSIPGLNLVSRRMVMTRHPMRFKFPLVGITFMVICFGIVLVAIRWAREISASFAGTVQKFGSHEFVYQPDRISLLQSFGFAFGLTLVVTVVVWALLHTLRRSGVHRLEDAQTWPQQ